MAVDGKAIVTLGYFPTITAEFTVRVISLGFIGTALGPIIGGAIRRATHITMALVGRMRL
jgi:hypothetical protein